jgi:hypothetical protein
MYLYEYYKIMNISSIYLLSIVIVTIILLSSLLVSVSRIRFVIVESSYCGLQKRIDVGNGWFIPFFHGSECIIGKSKELCNYQKSRLEHDFDIIHNYDFGEHVLSIRVSNWFFGRDREVLKGTFGPSPIFSRYESDQVFRSQVYNAIKNNKISIYELIYLMQFDEIAPALPDHEDWSPNATLILNYLSNK